MRAISCSAMLSLIVITSMSVSHPVAADGNELLAKCEKVVRVMDGDSVADDSFYDAGFCIGFVQATHQTLLLWSLADPGMDVCFPKSGIGNSQALRIIVKYLSEHPEELHEHEVGIAISALIEAFPCE